MPKGRSVFSYPVNDRRPSRTLDPELSAVWGGNPRNHVRARFSLEVAGHRLAKSLGAAGQP